MSVPALGSLMKISMLYHTHAICYVVLQGLLKHLLWPLARVKAASGFASEKIRSCGVSLNGNCSWFLDLSTTFAILMEIRVDAVKKSRSGIGSTVIKARISNTETISLEPIRRVMIQKQFRLDS